MAGAQFSQGELEARCRELATVLEGAGQIAPEAVEALTPGGKDNPDTSWWGWVRFYGRLQVAAEGPRPDAPGTDPLLDDARTADLLRGAPRRVRLVTPAAKSPTKDEEPQWVKVYPKAFEALVECHARGIRLNWLAEKVRLLEAHPSAEQLELLERTLKELAYQQRVLAWIVTTPGPGLPFSLESDRAPRPPKAFATWDGWDHLAVLQAFQEINGLRQPALDRLLHGAPRGDGGSGLVNTWSVFFGTYAQETGDDVGRIMRDRPLVPLLLQIRIAGASRAAAAADAKTRATAGE